MGGVQSIFVEGLLRGSLFVDGVYLFTVFVPYAPTVFVDRLANAFVEQVDGGEHICQAGGGRGG